MNEWFSSDVHGRAYTAEAIVRQLDEIDIDETRAEDSVLWYPVFAMEILKRSGAVT